MFTSPGTRPSTGPGTRRSARSRTVIAGTAALAAAGVVLAACSASSSPNAMSLAPSGAASTTMPSQPAAKAIGHELGATVSPTAPLIVRTGSITLQLKAGSVTRIFDQASEQVAALGGFVSSSSTSSTTMASLVLRVPSNEFSRIVSEIAGDGHTINEQLNGQDVTGQSINLRARIINLTTEEASLRSLMSRAGSIPSILAVQDQLFTVEGEIEQLTAQESSLVNQASFATLDVGLQSVPVAPHHPAGRSAISRAVTLAGHNTVAVIRDVLLAAGWAFPAALVALAVGTVIWARRRRRISGGSGGTGPTPVPAP